MWTITNPTDQLTHVVRNRRTATILGLECGKPASLARVDPADGEVTCPRCRERTGGLA